MKRQAMTRILLLVPAVITATIYVLGRRDLSSCREREIIGADGSRRQVADQTAISSENAPSGTRLLARDRRIWLDGARLTASVSRYEYRIDRWMGQYAYLEDHGAPDGKLVSPYFSLDRALSRFPPLRPCSWLGYSYVVTDEPIRKGSDFSLALPLWFPASIVYGATGALMLYRLGAHKRRRKGCCPKCNYDLRASKDRCPECGHPIPNPNRGAAVPPAP
jgi:hypothetical protein